MFSFKVVGNPDTSGIKVSALGLRIGFILVRASEQTCPNRQKGFIALSFRHKELFHAVLDTDTTSTGSVLREVYVMKKLYKQRELTL